MIRPVVFVPLIHRDEVAFFVAWRTGRGIEGAEIFCVGGEAVGHLVVDFQDAELGAVLPIFLFVFTLDYGESLHDVFYRMTGSGEIRQKLRCAFSLPVGLGAQVEVEIEGIQFTADFKSTLLVPDEGRSIIAAVLRK